jgi:2-iminoacetate synthase
MDLAKPGEIKTHCGPNALSTFQEYLSDYASPETRRAGETLIETRAAEMDDLARRLSNQLLRKVRAGERDVFV